MTATKAPPTVDQLLDAEGADHFLLAGVGDANLREVESLFGVRVVLRGAIPYASRARRNSWRPPPPSSNT